MPRTDEASYCALVKEMREKGFQDSIQYSRSTKKIENMSTADSKFYEGSYYHNKNDECKCLVRTSFSLTKYELLKGISHQNILSLISFDLKTKSVLTEKINAQIFQNYSNMNREKLVDNGGCMTSKLRGFIKLVLEVLAYLHKNNIVHGNLSASNIFVWENEEGGELQLKLFDICGPYSKDVKLLQRIDLIALATMIDDVTKADVDSPIGRFCKYISLPNQTIVGALRHPAVAIVTNYEKRVFLEKIMEQPKCVSILYGIQSNWIRDNETVIREEKSAQKTGNSYGDDMWSLVRLVRNTIKHHTDLQSPNIMSQLPIDKFAFLKHVESQNPNFMIDLYEALGHLV